MQVILDDPETKLSKTQRQKFVKIVRSQDKQAIDSAFRGLHYPEGTVPYAAYEMTHADDKIQVRLLSQDPAVLKRQELLTRLHRSMREKSKSERDPLWGAYKDLKGRVPVPLPNPDEVKENQALYRGILDQIDARNPIRQYFYDCLSV